MTKPTFHIVSDGSCDLPLPETEKPVSYTHLTLPTTPYV